MDNDGLHNSNTRTQPEQTDVVVPQFKSGSNQVGKKKAFEPAQVAPLPKKLPLALDVPAIQSKLATFKTRVNWGVVRVCMFFITVVAVIGGFLYWHYMNGMDSKSVTVAGYTYTFDFIRSAKLTQYSNGMRGYATDSDHSAIIGPVGGLSQLCGLKGDPYVIAFTVQIDSVTRPVCTAQDSQDEQMFMLTFTTQNQYHEIIITYGFAQNADVDATLLPIFESIHVSK